MVTGGSIKVARLDRFAMACVAMTLVLSGCAFTPEERATHAAHRAAPTAVVMNSPDAAANQPQHIKSPDGYPTFAGPLTAANVQMSDEQAANQQQQLSALTSARQAGTITEAEYQKRVEEMRKLAAEHGPDALSQISR